MVYFAMPWLVKGFRNVLPAAGRFIKVPETFLDFPPVAGTVTVLLGCLLLATIATNRYKYDTNKKPNDSEREMQYGM